MVFTYIEFACHQPLAAVIAHKYVVSSVSSSEMISQLTDPTFHLLLSATPFIYTCLLVVSSCSDANTYPAVMRTDQRFHKVCRLLLSPAASASRGYLLMVFMMGALIATHAPYLCGRSSSSSRAHQCSNRRTTYAAAYSSPASTILASAHTCVLPVLRLLGSRVASVAASKSKSVFFCLCLSATATATASADNQRQRPTFGIPTPLPSKPCQCNSCKCASPSRGSSAPPPIATALTFGLRNRNRTAPAPVPASNKLPCSPLLVPRSLSRGPRTRVHRTITQESKLGPCDCRGPTTPEAQGLRSKV